MKTQVTNTHCYTVKCALACHAIDCTVDAHILSLVAVKCVPHEATAQLLSVDARLPAACSLLADSQQRVELKDDVVQLSNQQWQQWLV